MSTLEVPGAILHYQTQGSGPALVLVPGANGEAGIFKPLADALQDAFTVGALRPPRLFGQPIDRRRTRRRPSLGGRR